MAKNYEFGFLNFWWRGVGIFGGDFEIIFVGVGKNVYFCRCI